ncbi:class I SAM-dependent methyltransferase [Thermogemmatispora carboxidivorans]|uniref:class I SAM-dependent methyltransferase n=1 Tax=Thermogemmatispora carboxidivorans TaxID=1382306 RepID=UPI00069C6FF3|nr:class I SAM-dependent methyltransferase [Thermogemmatispora carboxidivorans]
MPWWFSRRRSRAASTHRTGFEESVLASRPSSRRYLGQQPYMLPKDLGEVNRLDFQHYVLRAVLRGNYLAPIGQPRHILDVGCGTGQWAFELAHQFPQAEVVGLDLEQVKATTPPPNYRFVQGDTLKGLPFENNSFDFVHQRLLFLAIPLNAWPGAVQELARVTAPSGWIELIELSTDPDDFAPVGPATREFFRLAGQVATLRGFDTQGVLTRSLDLYLRDAGLTNVERRMIDAPIGAWAGRLGSLFSLDIREAWKAMTPPIAAYFKMQEQEIYDIIEQCGREWDTLNTCYRFVAAYGQKP